MTKLNKQLLEQWIQNQWVKYIDRETRKYNRYVEKERRQSFVVKALVARYNDLYPSNQIEIRESKERIV